MHGSCEGYQSREILRNVVKRASVYERKKNSDLAGFESMEFCRFKLNLLHEHFWYISLPSTHYNVVPLRQPGHSLVVVLAFCSFISNMLTEWFDVFQVVHMR